MIPLKRVINSFLSGSLPVFRLNIREKKTISIHKYFSTLREQTPPLTHDKPKENEIAATIQPMKKAHYYFNTYKIVKDLEVQGFTRSQAEAIMRGMEALLINGYKFIFILFLLFFFFINSIYLI
jgi:hypothetical protein